ncbi:MAG: hypothetical protein U5L46_16155 [Agrobacterium sp.]|nr:hypothetical protein [Agrobacterium sp.]
MDRRHEIHSGMWAGRAFPLHRGLPDLKTATAAVSTLIHGLYSNDFTLRAGLRKQYASRRTTPFLPPRQLPENGDENLI